MATSVSSHASIRIAPCADADVPLLRRFIDEHWGKGHVLARDARLLRWQFDPKLMASAGLPGPSVLLAWDEHDIVGMLALTGFTLNVRGSQVPAVWTCNWMAVPEVRGRGVGIRLFKEVLNLGYDVIGTLGVNPAAARILRILGFEVLDMRRWVGVLDVKSTAELLRAAAPGAVTSVDARTSAEEYAVVDRASHSPEVETLDWSDRMAERWNDAWRSTFARRLVSAERDAAYLRWRYLEHPRFDYRVTLARQRTRDRIEGLLVYRMEHLQGRGERILRVVEFLADTDAAAGALASALVKDGVRQGAAFADFYAISRQPAPGLETYGFRRESKPTFPTRFQPLEAPGYLISAAIRLPEDLRGTMEQLAEESTLYLTKSDADMDRPN